MPNATSIFIETGKLSSVETIAQELQKTLEKNFDELKTNEHEILNIYNNLLYRKNEISNFSSNSLGNFEGEIIRVDKNGEITISELNQQLSKYSESEIKLII